MSSRNDPLRQQLSNAIDWKEAHASFDQAVDGIPADKRGKRAPGFEHSAWQLLEHMRLAQWDILEFSRNPKHVSPEFPKGYWPATEDAGTVELWKESATKFNSDLKEMEQLVLNNSTDLYARIPHGEGQTVLREALLIADHNAYHLGALVVMARMLKTNA